MNSLGMISIVTEGMFEPGKVPPPAFALPRPIPMVAGNPCKLEEIATARARNASSEIFKAAIVGDFADLLIEMEIHRRL